MSASCCGGDPPASGDQPAKLNASPGRVPTPLPRPGVAFPGLYPVDAPDTRCRAMGMRDGAGDDINVAPAARYGVGGDAGERLLLSSIAPPPLPALHGAPLALPTDGRGVA